MGMRHFLCPYAPILMLRERVFGGRFWGFCKTLKIRCLKRRKIQGTYFKISALYFKIYGLYFSLFQKAEKQRIGRMAKLRLFLDFFVDYFLDTFLYFSTGCAICVLENSILAINGKCTELPAVFRKLCTFFYYCFIIGYPTFCTVILPSKPMASAV